MPPVLGYWKTRCLGQPIRLLLAYKEVEFEDKRYEVGDPPEYDKSCWLSVKFKMGFDFPNLPYYIDGDVKITQSIAILRYLARKYDLEGKTEEEKLRVDILANQAMDLAKELFTVFIFEYDRKPQLVKGLPVKMKQLSDFLGDRTWFAGERLTFVDFMLYEFLEVHRIVAPTCLDGASNLQRFLARVEALPSIKKYMASPSFMATPLFNKYSPYEIEQKALKEKK
ncbi:glutathione S-transferase Mu 4-like isoform X6 [Eriocheir sinensis]|uniref:glutathione S-transferase Mu 4-like isoform X5 n=1 Tax=Eriocheir sinensis TaxID=95602 RepID=UPI0021C9F857|nr:glutathione S-transferase Mu 4-like isoform X5 [Eriocheir sinensis]XP_050693150.1 glutathione S-transferase Mu 4-like isoform X6 [Eriocheir sinensis]